jgi:hypothetical protein
MRVGVALGDTLRLVAQDAGLERLGGAALIEHRRESVTQVVRLVVSGRPAAVRRAYRSSSAKPTAWGATPSLSWAEAVEIWGIIPGIGRRVAEQLVAEFDSGVGEALTLSGMR